MTQEEKHLLLLDLCARLPYGTIIHTWYEKSLDIKYVGVNVYTNTVDLDIPEDDDACVYVDNVKPYLRPMSSMTEEEKRHISKMMCLSTYNDGVVYDMNYPVYTPYYVMDDCLNYLRSIHVDYSGLIEKGLALEAKEGMYNIKEK